MKIGKINGVKKMNGLEQKAEKNMNSIFVDNPCRGIVLGMNNNGEQVQLSWIMGRSFNSQNRVYVVEKENGILRTEAADPSKVEDPSLIIYNAMRSINEAHIVSNGVQTDSIYDSFMQQHGLLRPEEFFNELSRHYCEPDPPIFTPRISSCQYLHTPTKAYFSILRADPFKKEHWLKTIEKHGLKEEQFENREAFNNEVSRLSGLHYEMFPTERDEFVRGVGPGFGYCITTYKPGHETLDSFDSTPFIVLTQGPLERIMESFWNSLEEKWRVSLGGKVIYGDNSYRMVNPINKNEKVGG